MKYKVSITKTIALVLCIVTITLSQNIYSSFKDLYFENDSYKENIIYTAMANTSLNNSLSTSLNASLNNSLSTLLNNLNISIKHSTQPLTLTPKIKSNKANIQKKIFVNVLLLFISFITLASLHNFILKVQIAQGYSYLNLRNKLKNKKPNINLTSSIAHEEGVK